MSQPARAAHATPNCSRLLRQLAVATVAGLLCSSAAQAASADSKAQARAQFRQDMADCNSPSSSQDPATCRREARNALAEAMRDGLDGNPDLYPKNVLQRCNAYLGSERIACQERMGPYGQLSGSVEGGGILRQSVISVPAN